jgi:hypothetical protein
MAETTITQRDADERIHESNPFRNRFSCKCGKLKGIDHKDETCDFCFTKCVLLPERKRNYKGWLHDQRNQTTRLLNSKESRFNDQIYISINSNHETVRKINSSEFFMARLNEIINCSITDCKYINDRVNHPDDYDTDITDAFNKVFDYEDYIIQEVFYSWLGEKARDTLHQPAIDTMVQEFTNIIATELILWVKA